MKPSVPELQAIVLYDRCLCNVICDEIFAYGKDLNNWLDKTREIMYSINGVALSGPQVGIFFRYCLINLGTTKVETVELINPVIEDAFGQEIGHEEGCVAVPGAKATVRRPKTVRVSWRDRQGHEQRDEFEGTDAMLIQHEVDHLNGMYFPDRLSGLMKDLVLAKMWKYRKQYLRQEPAAKAISQCY
jgi:peptide deformylase